MSLQPTKNPEKQNSQLAFSLHCHCGIRSQSIEENVFSYMYSEFLNSHFYMLQEHVG